MHISQKHIEFTFFDGHPLTGLHNNDYHNQLTRFKTAWSAIQGMQVQFATASQVLNTL